MFTLRIKWQGYSAFVQSYLVFKNREVAGEVGEYIVKKLGAQGFQLVPLVEINSIEDYLAHELETAK